MTAENLEVAFGFVMDGAAILAIVVYIPIANYRIRRRDRFERVWRKIENNLYDNEWGELEVKNK